MDKRMNGGQAPQDPDLLEQAKRGHGIPSQDPDVSAQYPLEPSEAGQEHESVWVGGGALLGVATGAAVGTSMAGPAGVVVGGTLGAVAGALVGAAAGRRLEDR